MGQATRRCGGLTAVRVSQPWRLATRRPVPLTLASSPAGLRPPSITRVCVNSTKPLPIDPEVTRWKSRPFRTIIHDSVDSCVTNHRIVREHAGGLLRRSWHTLLARGRGRLRTAPPRAQRRGKLRLIARQRELTARRDSRPADPVSSSTGVSPCQLQRTLKGSRRECRHPGLRDGADVAFSSSAAQPGGNAPG